MRYGIRMIAYRPKCGRCNGDEKMNGLLVIEREDDAIFQGCHPHAEESAVKGDQR
jgi:hypothetical protein